MSQHHTIVYTWEHHSHFENLKKIPFYSAVGFTLNIVFSTFRIHDLMRIYHDRHQATVLSIQAKINDFCLSTLQKHALFTSIAERCIGYFKAAWLVYHWEHLFLKGRVGYCRSSAMQNLISTPMHNHVPVVYILGPQITTTTGKCDSWSYTSYTHYPSLRTGITVHSVTLNNNRPFMFMSP